MSTVYLLHFSERYPAGRRPQHYVGVAKDVDRRVAEHRAGNPGKGGSLTRAIKAKGITFVVAEEWHFGTSDEAFEFERKLKRQRKHSKHCPVCRGGVLKRRAEELARLGPAMVTGMVAAFGLCNAKTRAEKRRCARAKR